MARQNLFGEMTQLSGSDLICTCFELSACVLTCIGALVIGTTKFVLHRLVERFLSVLFHQDGISYI